MTSDDRGPDAPHEPPDRARSSPPASDSPQAQDAEGAQAGAHPARDVPPASGGPIRAIASHMTRGLEKLNARLIPTMPGQEAAAIAALEFDGDDPVLLLGERLAAVPGAFSAALAHPANPRIGWIPPPPMATMPTPTTRARTA